MFIGALESFDMRCYTYSIRSSSVRVIVCSIRDYIVDGGVIRDLFLRPSGTYVYMENFIRLAREMDDDLENVCYCDPINVNSLFALIAKVFELVVGR